MTPPTKKRMVYGDPLTPLFSILRNLRLKYGRPKDNVGNVLIIKDFYVKIVVDAKTEEVSDSVFKVIHYKTSWEVDKQRSFGEELMFILIDRGYMAYINEHPDGGRGRIYKSLLIEHGWARKIVNKRLEDWKGRRDREFVYNRTHAVFNEFSIHELVDRFPGFFDFLSY